MSSLPPGTPAPAATWDLSDLFAGPDDPRIDQELANAARDAEEFARTYRGTIDVPGGPSVQHLLAALQAFEAVIERLERVEAYSHLLFSADTANPIHRDLQQKVRQRATAIQTTLLFFELEWQKVDDTAAAQLMDAPELARYRYYLQRERRNRPHTL
ncbi:MAG TPA: oligoendopeptidase, partial [Chloroflexota bacterium]|nr:oligoendopeptidase [Chloroflexota bacterium]